METAGKRILVALVILLLGPAAHADTDRVELPIQVESFDRIELERRGDGSHTYILHGHDGRTEHYAPDQFAALMHDQYAHIPWWKLLLNISTPMGMAWVGLGLLGQILFAGRMIVQWLVSEKHKRSVVPVAFWWMSLIGAMMLVAYFIWRRDPIGILGQGTGWAIYARNLWLIHRHRPVDVGPATSVEVAGE